MLGTVTEPIPVPEAEKPSRENSIYRHLHTPDQKPLNLTDAQILKECRSIVLPFHSMDDVNELSVDIGGSLAKMVYFSNTEQGCTLNFYCLETNKINEFVEKIENIVRENYKDKEVTIIATGGGAHKYYDLLSRSGLVVQKEDEMQCLIIGLDFFITGGIPNEVFYYQADDASFVTEESVGEVYPYLLVNIGSGVSMVKVTGPKEGNFERVGGSSLGGGTLWGLLSILTDANTFDEMLEMATRGNNENVDLLVGDIYGTGYNKIGLKANHIASSMGKVFKEVVSGDVEDTLTREERLSKFKQEDIAQSLLYAVSYNIGQIAYLQAQRHELKKIYFAGSYIRNHIQTIRTLSFAIEFWSKGEKRAYFLNHEGYLGAMGAFLLRRESSNCSSSE
ncbi:hypothetical protein CANINC_002560 [Pichia inconspicua]|uniref:Pantothenate kinase n=1 Tax=Pichia inconspicua TaxID=52247 RepID=A0A4T0X2N7_9ASCO|nr:hypothetical protein CANINC_002560 [[Candida] inconspicua]